MTTALATISPWTDWDSKMKFAKQLVDTGFLPRAVDTPGKALAIIFAGQEIGIPPMHALRSINVIQGKPSLAAELQLALFKQRGGRSKWIRSDAEVAEIWLRHPNGDEHTESFTIEDAKRAGLLKKEGGWQFYPKAMLRARASSAGLRAVAPDIVAGIYDPEELGAVVNVDGEIVVPPAVQLFTEKTEILREKTAEIEAAREDLESRLHDRGQASVAPIEDWREAFAAAQSEKAGDHLKAGLRKVWGTFTKSEQIDLVEIVRANDERWAAAKSDGAA